MLTLSLMSTVAFASNKADTILVIQDSPTMYSITHDKKIGEVAYLTDYEGVYELSDSTLILETGTQNYEVVVKHTLNLSDKASIEEFLSYSNLDEVIKNDILEKSTKAFEDGNSDAIVDIFVPYESMLEVTSTTYYTYDGYNLKDMLVYYTNLNTGYQVVKEGSATISAASSLVNGVASSIGISNNFVNLFLSVMTALEAYEDETNLYPSESAFSDRIQHKLYYNVYDKYTYVDYMGDYVLGTVTQRVYLLNSITEQYYVNYYGGNEVITTKQHSRSIATKNYYSPASEAIVNVYGGYLPWIEEIEYDILNLTIHF